MMVVADGLVDFHISRSLGSTVATKMPKGKGKRPVDQKKGQSQESSQGYGKTGAQEKSKEMTFFGCFICSSLHRARDCPKKEKLSAIMEEGSQAEEAGPSHINPLQLINAVCMEQAI